MKKSLLLSLLLLGSVAVMSQQSGKAYISGLVRDAVSEAPIELVTVYIKGTNTVVETAANGRYRLEVPVNEEAVIVFSRIGYKEAQYELKPMPPNTTRQVDVSLASTDTGLEVVVRDSRIQESGMVREDMAQLKLLPTTTGNLESVLPHIALGASSGSGGELTSQYNVRGGNYDENLVYVNDFEIYRPQLIRAGQQEGLTFPNIDLINSLSFSSGGFEARYGDKMSSVLDVKYKRPDSLRASVSAGFLGGSAHVEGSLLPMGENGPKRLRYLLGAR
ncbi:MAG TPA: carboxypeptidase-like regulatory domain-containing protein, partial [Saprospiraceae bacterium]|nr:carboxypeptidase-like regulatory domain-containing protein [Saprospiraceae bacterium]